MTDTTAVMALIALVLSMLAALLIVAGYNRMRGRRVPPLGPGRSRQSDHAGERLASAPAELMQAIIRREMASEPAFAGRSIDFGTAPDGSLEIWVDGQLHAGVDQIPDVRLRELIARAAEEFNRGVPAAS